MEPTPIRTEIQRGEHAREALQNPLIAEALNAWEKDITEAWKTSPLRDAEGRERLRLMLEAAQQFRAHLTRTMETGELAKAQMAEESRLKRAWQVIRS